MARVGETIVNAATGEEITWLRVDADVLAWEDRWMRPGHRAARHVHPSMTERWEVIQGTAAFRIGDAEERRAGPGEVVVVPPGTRHLAWNPAEETVRLRVQMRPALRWQEFVERLFADPARGGELLGEFSREIVF